MQLQKLSAKLSDKSDAKQKHSLVWGLYYLIQSAQHANVHISIHPIPDQKKKYDNNDGEVPSWEEIEFNEFHVTIHEEHYFFTDRGELPDAPYRGRQAPWTADNWKVAINTAAGFLGGNQQYWINRLSDQLAAKLPPATPLAPTPATFPGAVLAPGPHAVPAPGHGGRGGPGVVPASTQNPRALRKPSASAPRHEANTKRIELSKAMHAWRTTPMETTADRKRQNTEAFATTKTNDNNTPSLPPAPPVPFNPYADLPPPRHSGGPGPTTPGPERARSEEEEDAPKRRKTEAFTTTTTTTTSTNNDNNSTPGLPPASPAPFDLCADLPPPLHSGGPGPTAPGPAHAHSEDEAVENEEEEEDEVAATQATDRKTADD